MLLHMNWTCTGVRPISNCRSIYSPGMKCQTKARSYQRIHRCCHDVFMAAEHFSLLPLQSSILIITYSHRATPASELRMPLDANFVAFVNISRPLEHHNYC